MSHTDPEFQDRRATIEDAVVALKGAYDGELRTIIAIVTFYLGQEVRRLEEVSRRTSVNIILATGSLRTVPPVFWNVSLDDIAPLYVKEIEERIEGTGTNAGVIKSASDRGGITDQVLIPHRSALRPTASRRL